MTNAVKDLVHKYRLDVASELGKGFLKYSGAITIDDVHLKVQDKHLYDCLWTIFSAILRLSRMMRR